MLMGGDSVAWRALVGDSRQPHHSAITYVGISIGFAAALAHYYPGAAMVMVSSMVSSMIFARPSRTMMAA